MMTRKVLIAAGATAGVAGLGLALYLWLRRPPPPPPKVETRMTVTEEPPSSVYPGQELPFAGYLEDVNGNRLASKRINLFVNDVLVIYQITSLDGGWDFSGTVAEDAPPSTWVIYAEFSGDEEYIGCSRGW